VEAAERRAARRDALRERQAARRKVLRETQDERRRAKQAAKEARVAAKIFDHARRKADAVRARHEAEVAFLEEGLGRTEREAAAALEEHRALLAQIESRALAAERRAASARARVAEAHERAAEARALAKEASRPTEASSAEAARLDAERRLEAQAQRQLELECAELRGRLAELRTRVGAEAAYGEERRPSDNGAGPQNRGGDRAPARISPGAIRSSSRLRELERRAAAAARRVTAAELNLAREAERLEVALQRRVAEETGSARATIEVELAVARRQLAEARQRARAAIQASGLAKERPPSDPLDALAESLTDREHPRDGSESPPEPDRLPANRRSLFGRIRARLPV
jgi:hypothetical protein